MDAKTIIERFEATNDFGDRVSSKMMALVCTIDGGINQMFFSNQSYNSGFVDFLSPYNDDIKVFAAKLMFRVIADIPDNNYSDAVVSKDIIQNDLTSWYNDKSSTIGIAAAGSCIKDIVPEAFDDVADSANNLFNALTDKNIMTGLLDYDVSDSRHLIFPLLWCLMYYLDQDKCHALEDEWRKAPETERLAESGKFMWLQMLGQLLDPNSGYFGDLKNKVKNLIHKVEYVKTEKKDEVIDITSSGAPIIAHYKIDIYREGEAVYNWMKSSAAACYLSGTKPKIPETAKKQRDDPGCVLADSKILMKDGEWKNILEIKEGDEIINADGTISECSGEVIMNDHVRLLYSINDDKPCMSTEHMILTASGYKCPDPKTALLINPHIRVSQLRVGDVVIKWENGKKVPIRVEKINFVNDNAALCADIHVTDGKKSYITDSGYICFVNYPEYTTQRILKEAAEKKMDLDSFLENGEEELRAMFGDTAYKYLKTQARECGHIKTIKSTIPKWKIASMERSDYKIYADESVGFSVMHVIRGFAFFDDDDTPVPLQIEDDAIMWQRGNVQGYCKVFNNGFFLKGHIVSDSKTINFLATTGQYYDMEFTSKENDVYKFGYYYMGYEILNGAPVQIAKWKMLKNGSQEYGFSIDTTNQIGTFAYTLDDQYELCGNAEFSGLGKYAYEELIKTGCDSTKFTFSTLFDVVNGVAYKKMDVAGEYKDVEIGTIVGKLDPDIQEVRRKLSLCLASNLENGLSNECILTSAERNSLKEVYEPSVEDLFRLPIPNDNEGIHSEAFKLFMNMAAYEVYQNEDDAKDLLGIPRPVVNDCGGDLTHELADIADNYSDFLIKNFVWGYLSHWYAKEGANPDAKQEFLDSVKNLTDIDKALERTYYNMCGNGKNCLGFSKEYLELSNITYKAQYLKNVVGLDLFVNGNPDQQSEWARQFYEKLIDPNVLNGLIMTQMQQPENPRLTFYYTVLEILDDKPHLPMFDSENKDDDPSTQLYSYATVLRTKVIDITFKQMIPNIKFPAPNNDDTDFETYAQFIARYLRLYIQKVLDKDFHGWDDDTRKEVEQEVEKMREFYNKKSVEDLLDSLDEISMDILGEFFSLAQESSCLGEAVLKFFKGHPHIAGCLAGAFYAVAGYMIITGFKGWQELDVEDKIALCLSCAEIAVTACMDFSIVKAMKALKSGMGDVVLADAEMTKLTTKYGFMEVLAEKNPLQTIESMGVDAISDGARFWIKFSRYSKAVAECLGKIVVFATMGLTAYEIYRDVQNNDPVGIALDTLILLSDTIIFLSMFETLTALCSALPVIGAVAFVAGIILSIVAIFVKKKNLDSTMKNYVDNYLVGYVKGLEIPPAEWLDKHPMDKEEKHDDDDSLIIGTDLVFA